jgi:hypothetical protein
MQLKGPIIDWDIDVAHERHRQIEKGYTPEHDDEHGVQHILQEAYDRLRDGKTAQAGALLLAADAALERANQSKGKEI